MYELVDLKSEINIKLVFGRLHDNFKSLLKVLWFCRKKTK